MLDYPRERCLVRIWGKAGVEMQMLDLRDLLYRCGGVMTCATAIGKGAQSGRVKRWRIEDGIF